MSDDRSPVDGWFRDEPDAGATQSEPGPYGAPHPVPGRPPTPPEGARFPGAAPTPFPGALPAAGAQSPDDAPTQVGALPPVPPIPHQTSGEYGSTAQPQWQPRPQWQPPQGAGSMYGAGPGLDPVPPPAADGFPGQPPAANQDPVYSYPEYEPHPHDRRANGRRTSLIAGGAVAGAAALGLIAYLGLSGGPAAKSGGSTGAHGTAAAPGASPSPTHTSFQPTSADPITAAEQTGSAFLNAWQSGDLQEAAKYTDDPTDALAALTAYKSSLNLSALTLKPQAAKLAGSSPSSSSSSSAGSPGTGSSSNASPATGSGNASSGPSSAASGSPAGSPAGTVPFSATATVSMDGKNGTMPWNYSSSLVAYKQSDGWSVRWSPSILAPGMTDGQKLAVMPMPPSVGKVVDSSGQKLSSYSDSALQTIASTLEKKAPTGTGTAGVAVQLTDASGKVVGDTPVATLQKPVDATVLKTTIDPTVQSLARAAVGMHSRSSMVVLRPSTGAILAVANSAGSGDTALTGGLAPGSTFKIVTSAALLNHGYVSLYSPVACPLTYTVQGVVYHNSTDSEGKNEESLPVGTPFITDFAQSCNNAFTQFYKQLEGGKLAGTASAYFGLDESWDIGLGPNSYFGIPGDSSGAELAQENFGQGRVVASPLAMASVAATVGTGYFHQPYLVSGVQKATANALPSSTDANLKTMMHAVVVSGTAAGVFSGISGPLYAKTGTAEADANQDGKPNAWMVVDDPHLDVAIAVVVQDSGFGATYAGPQAAYVLSHL